MDRITLRLDDELGARLAAEAGRTGVSRTRLVRELLITHLAQLEGPGRAGDVVTRLAAVERQVRLLQAHVIRGHRLLAAREHV
ncbi:MAG: ribbon-helix-helix protein, CopG family [Thermoleophilaceae bacterium]